MTRLAHAKEIFVEARGGRAASQIFVTADESELIVLDLAGPPLNSKVRRILREIASTHLMGLSLVGLPIAGGWLGYQGNPRTTQDVIYRADP